MVFSVPDKVDSQPSQDKFQEETIHKVKLQGSRCRGRSRSETSENVKVDYPCKEIQLTFGTEVCFKSFIT